MNSVRRSDLPHDIEQKEKRHDTLNASLQKQIDALDNCADWARWSKRVTKSPRFDKTDRTVCRSR